MGFLDFLKNNFNGDKKLTADPEAPIFEDLDVGRIRLGLIVGHESAHQGAVIDFVNIKGTKLEHITEYAYNSEIALLVKERCQNKYVEVVIIFRDEIGIAGAYAKAESLKCDIALELHFNADVNREYFGTETLCSTNSDDLYLANIMNSEIFKVFGRRNRGVKAIAKNSRGGANVWAMSNTANCLLEPFFGTNMLDAYIGLTKREEYADAIVRGVITYAKAKQIHLGAFI